MKLINITKFLVCVRFNSIIFNIIVFQNTCLRHVHPTSDFRGCNMQAVSDLFETIEGMALTYAMGCQIMEDMVLERWPIRL